MCARNTRRPLCEREVRVGLGDKGKRVKQNQTDMMQLRRGCLQGVKISGRGRYLAARMGFRHPHIPAPSRHLLAALPLSWGHRCIGHRACHHRQCGEQYRQNENAESTRECQQGHCSGNCKLDATGQHTTAGTAKVRGSRIRHHILWAGCGLGNGSRLAPALSLQRAFFSQAHFLPGGRRPLPPISLSSWFPTQRRTISALRRYSVTA
jgi:hypothetical protein